MDEKITIPSINEVAKNYTTKQLKKFNLEKLISQAFIDGVEYGMEQVLTKKVKENKQTVILTTATFVDLGLSVKWCDRNIGATCGDTVESWYGKYFSHGETEEKTDYTWGTYKFGNWDELTKYCKEDRKRVLEPCDDVATTTYGDGYRMPTNEEYKELLSLPNEWVEDYRDIKGLSGRLFHGKGEYSENTLFIPFAGRFDGSELSLAGSYGYLWTLAVNEDYPCNAWYFYFCAYDMGINHRGRYNGFSVRGVSEL